jgi:HK97 gp10 family phage protein
MIDAKVQGIPDLKRELAGIVPKLRVRALRNALAAGARLVQRSARQSAPVLSASSLAVRKGYRTPGLVRKAISVRTSKVARRQGDVGVFVNVRPAKRGVRGAKSPSDPFYWRFIEFGTASGTRAFQFLQRGAEKLPEALEAFKRAIGPQIQKLNKPKAPAP